MKVKQWAASLFFPIFMTGLSVFAYVWESLKNGDLSVRFAYRGAYIAFAAIGLLIIILTCALKIDTSEYFISRLVIFVITAVIWFAVIWRFADEFNAWLTWLPVLLLFILLANIISTQVVVFRKYASAREWLICLFSNPVLELLVCPIMVVSAGDSLAGSRYYSFM